jgi:transcriptional regulator with XRE-family HTH domain
MPPPSHFADNITRLAGMHGLTQSQLAKVLGVTPQSVSLWRSGREPSTAVVMKASEVFKLPAEKLFSVEFSKLMPLMDDPEDYREVEKNIQRRLSNLKGV